MGSGAEAPADSGRRRRDQKLIKIAFLRRILSEATVGARSRGHVGDGHHTGDEQRSRRHALGTENFVLALDLRGRAPKRRDGGRAMWNACLEDQVACVREAG
jgi:hypothetical protein